jgi:hypothetical protein
MALTSTFLAQLMPNSAWMYNFVHDRLSNGNALKILCVLDEHIYPMSSNPKLVSIPNFDGELNPPLHMDIQRKSHNVH